MILLVFLFSFTLVIFDINNSWSVPPSGTSSEVNVHNNNNNREGLPGMDPVHLYLRACSTAI